MKNIVMITLAILMMLAVCGCTANISISDSTGIHKLMSSEEIYSKKLLQENKNDKAEESRSIILEYDNGTVDIEINAIIDCKYDINLLKGKLQPYEINQKVVIDKFAFDKSKTTRENSDGKTILSIANDSGYTQNLRITSYGFSFTDNKLMKEIYVNKENVDNNVKPILPEETIREVTDIITTVTTNDISISSLNVYKSVLTEELFYEIIFSQKIEGIAFETTNATNPNMIKATGSAIIGDDGIGSISYDTFFNTYDVVEVKKYLQIEDAFELLQSYVDKYYNFVDCILINKAEINYLAKITKFDGIVFYPVWVFTIDEDVLESKYPLSGSIIINAVTGQIETLD